jgi:hypothetical protein
VPVEKTEGALHQVQAQGSLLGPDSSSTHLNRSCHWPFLFSHHRDLIEHYFGLSPL